MQSADWDRLFKLGTYVRDSPDIPVLEFVEEHFSSIDRTLSTTVLDLGCGYGRHMEILLKSGITAVGLDSSAYALALARKKLPDAILINSDIEKLPLPDKCFDGMISTKVLQHNTIPQRRLQNIVLEMARVMKESRSLIITVASTRHKEFGVGRELSSNTFLIQEGPHKGVTQHYFEEKELRSLFEASGFEVSSIRHDETSANLVLIASKT